MDAPSYTDAQSPLKSCRSTFLKVENKPVLNRFENRTEQKSGLCERQPDREMDGWKDGWMN